ncbi:MAG: ATP-binding protein [Lysobacterales bacterium]|jgi:two-component system sensor histidine kinase BaeS
MRSLLSKILLAQAVTVLIALVVVIVITRYSLNQGFLEFLERQEGAVLQNLAPELSDLYASEGGWDFLREQPENWFRVLRKTRDKVAPVPGGNHRPGRRFRDAGTPGEPWTPPAGQHLNWLRSFDRLQLRDRLFLLDASHQPVAGAAGPSPDEKRLQPVEAEGEVVGWVGFRPVEQAMPPDVSRFLNRQLRILFLSLLVALALAAIPGIALARHFSRPIRELESTVGELSRGSYDGRAKVATADEIGRLAGNVNQLAEALEKSRSARQRWMADIAHELRTPVAIIRGEIEALADGVRQADERTIGSLQEEIGQLSDLVDELQTLALSDAGALDLHRERVDLAALVAQVGESFAHRFQEREIHFEPPAPEGQPAIGDPRRLRQLLHNLLENCSRYVDRGGTVRIAIDRTEGGVELLVEDSGPGVDDEQLAQLFERFYRVDGSRSRAGGGSGLGLAICRNIAEAHGGSIEARHSRLGGLAMHVTLPE